MNSDASNWSWVQNKTFVVNRKSLLVLPFCKPEWCFQTSLKSELLHILGANGYTYLSRWNTGSHHTLDETGVFTTPLDETGVHLPPLDETGVSPPSLVGWNMGINSHAVLCVWDLQSRDFLSFRISLFCY